MRTGTIVDLDENDAVSSALAGELRERMVRAAFDAFWAEGTPFTQIEHDIFGQVVDAVIAVLNGEGDR